jgi:2-succinyl-5-enolpyruvyl-6-hydroxy-3-cyclohexene-1-carboxylate synthase
VIPADPAAALSTMAACVRDEGARPDGTWREHWHSIDQLARCAIDASLASVDELFEGRALAEVVAAMPDGGTLMVGNSMPVRDLDTFARGDCRYLRLVANRGAHGIDGVVSSALGAAAIADGPVALVVGDLSFYHDMNGLLAARRHGLSATIVVLNNDGGGIFSFLPQAEQLAAETFEALFGTPIGLDVERAAQLYGAAYAGPTCWPAFQKAFKSAIAREGLSIIEIKTDRRRNVELHRMVAASVAAALHGAREVVG